MRLRSTLIAILLWTASASAEPTASKAFIEGGLGYGYELTTSNYLEVNRGTLLDSPHASGPSLDLDGGYALAPHAFLFGDLQWAHASTLKSENQNGDTSQTSLSYKSLSLGLRATVPLGSGELYAQMSLGVALPFQTETDQVMANGDTRTTVIGYNSGLGARSEMGYHFNLNERMYIAAGLRLQAFATDNAGKTRVRTDQPGGNVDTTVYSTDPNANNADRAQSLSVQDIRLRIGFGYRF